MSLPSSSRLRGPAVTLALVATLAHATVVKDESIETMTAHAHAVVRGTVRSVQPMADRTGRIWTYVEVAVAETLKGDVPKLVLVKQPGGEIGARGQWVAGVAKFQPGQDCLLFLERAADEAQVHIVYALAAGKVDFEAKGDSVVAVRHLDGLAFAAPGSTATRPVTTLDTLGTREAFLARVRAAARGAQ